MILAQHYNHYGTQNQDLEREASYCGRPAQSLRQIHLLSPPHLKLTNLYVRYLKAGLQLLMICVLKLRSATKPMQAVQ